jgi:hypothetical protein
MALNPFRRETTQHREGKQLVVDYLNAGGIVRATRRCKRCKRAITSSVCLGGIDGKNPVTFCKEVGIKLWDRDLKTFVKGRLDVAGLDAVGQPVVAVEVVQTHKTADGTTPRIAIPWIEIAASRIACLIDYDREKWGDAVDFIDRRIVSCAECDDSGLASAVPRLPPKRWTASVANPDPDIELFCTANRATLFAEMWDGVCDGKASDRLLRERFGIGAESLLCRGRDVGMDAMHVRGMVEELVRSDGYLALLDLNATCRELAQKNAKIADEKSGLQEEIAGLRRQVEGLQTELSEEKKYDANVTGALVAGLETLTEKCSALRRDLDAVERKRKAKEFSQEETRPECKTARTGSRYFKSAEIPRAKNGSVCPEPQKSRFFAAGSSDIVCNVDLDELPDALHRYRRCRECKKVEIFPFAD